MHVEVSFFRINSNRITNGNSRQRTIPRTIISLQRYHRWISHISIPLIRAGINDASIAQKKQTKPDDSISEDRVNNWKLIISPCGFEINKIKNVTFLTHGALCWPNGWTLRFENIPGSLWCHSKIAIAIHIFWSFGLFLLKSCRVSLTDVNISETFWMSFWYTRLLLDELFPLERNKLNWLGFVVPNGYTGY